MLIVGTNSVSDSSSVRYININRGDSNKRNIVERSQDRVFQPESMLTKRDMVDWTERGAQSVFDQLEMPTGSKSGTKPVEDVATVNQHMIKSHCRNWNGPGTSTVERPQHCLLKWR